MDWFVATLRQYPEIALFLSLGIGYWVGGKSYKGFSLGAVTATLLAAIAIGQLGIKISGDVKSTFFLIFLFAIGYGVGPQFVRGITKDGVPQAIYAAIVCVFCLGACVIVAKAAGYDSGAAAGLFAGSQTISASMGLATDAINRLALTPDKTKAMLDIMPTAYAVTYIFGTIGSAIVIAIFGPMLLRIDLKKAAKEYEELHGGKRELGGLGDAWRAYDVRAFLIAPDAQVVGKTVRETEALLTEATKALGNQMYVLAVRRDGKISEATSDLVLQAGDHASVVGERDQVIALLGRASKEVDDPELLSAPIEGVNVYITSKAADGKTLAELGSLPGARGVYVRRIKRGFTETPIPVLGDSKLYRGDVVTLVGRTQDTSVAAAALGVVDRADRRHRRRVPRHRDHDRCTDRRGRPEDRRGSDYAFDGRRRADLGNRCGMVPRDSSDLRPHSVAGTVVHELRRPQHVHRRHRTHRRSEVRRRAPAARLRPLFMGRRRHDASR